MAWFRGLRGEAAAFLRSGARLTLDMNPSRLVLVLKVVAVFACLYLFIVGVSGMGYSFKLFGKEFSERVLMATSSPIVGLFLGILATALVQSSSTSTSVIVGMVAGGAISIEGAIPMVMGANIGTTLTSMLVSLGHIHRGAEFQRAFSASSLHATFNVFVVLILFPLEMATGFLAFAASGLAELFQQAGGMRISNPLAAATQPAIHLLAWLVGEHPVALLILTLLLTFGTLIAIVKLLKSMVLKKVEMFFDEHLFKTAWRSIVFGFLLTVAVQTSSIPTSLMIPLAAAGILKIMQIYPYSLGCNVGTTVTATLAALATGNPAAITVAFAHVLFNIIGLVVVWTVPFLRRIPPRIAAKVAEHARKNRLIPVLIIALLYFIIPAVVLLLTRLI
jgi:solute carrier family 34 (sodium-dependent phosphate cotransporter)